MYQYPADLELPSVEFKAMPSGSHVVSHDFSYYAVTDESYGASTHTHTHTYNTHTHINLPPLHGAGFLCERRPERAAEGSTRGSAHLTLLPPPPPLSFAFFARAQA